MDGLKVVSGGSSIKWNVSGETYFWQPGGDGAEQSVPGGYPSSGGAKPVEFDITAGTVKIYPTGNGLRFYKIEFHSN